MTPMLYRRSPTNLNVIDFIELDLDGMTTVFNEHQVISVGAIMQCSSMKPCGP